jgi:23S rRNA pseudouridine1911/1915/1917 synthase
MPWITRQAVVAAASPHVGGRIDRLVQALAGGTRSHVAGLFDHGCVTFNGQPMHETGWRLAAGDRVEVRWEAGRRYSPLPKARPHRGFEVVHEDRALIVVDKAPELLTVPTRRGERYTLVERVSEYVRRSGGGRGAFPVHRLDRGVSGLLVLAKSPDIEQLLRDQFAARKPERQYVAIVAGHLAQTAGEFRSYLATDKDLNRYSTDDRQIGQLAVTHYQGVERLADTTLVAVRLETGRRNQIRVHFAEAGHPVLGDPRYKAAAARHRNWPHERIALHAQTLGFDHPVTGERMLFDSRLPAEMVRFINQSRGGPPDGDETRRPAAAGSTAASGRARQRLRRRKRKGR